VRADNFATAELDGSWTRHLGQHVPTIPEGARIDFMDRDGYVWANVDPVQRDAAAFWVWESPERPQPYPSLDIIAWRIAVPGAREGYPS